MPDDELADGMRALGPSLGGKRRLGSGGNRIELTIAGPPLGARMLTRAHAAHTRSHRSSSPCH